MDGQSARRALLVAVVMVALAVGSNAFRIPRVLAPRPGPSEAVGHDPRLAALKRMLPASGVVGYAGDRDDVLSNRSARRAYYRTQYALAPLVLDLRPGHRLVVGNFRNEEAATRALEQGRLTLVADLGGGLQLLRFGGPAEQAPKPAN